jgi:hypothetical protein
MEDSNMDIIIEEQFFKFIIDITKYQPGVYDDKDDNP